MLTFLAILLMFPWIQVLAQTCSSSYSLRNMRLKGHVFKTHTAIQASDRCIDKCAWQAGCNSINYCSSQGTCELNNASHLSNPESLVSSIGYEYLNYLFRVVARCSNKLCSYPLECEVDNNGQDYKCNSCKDQQKVLTFPNKTATERVMYENPFVQLAAFTISMWVQIDPSTDFHTAFSYGTVDEYNEILIEFKSEFMRLYIHDSQRRFAPTFDNQWHHVCVTWTNVDGNYSMYVDGISKGEGNKKGGHVIKKGAVVLGQDQDSYKGGFQATSSFQGKMTSVNMWDKVLTADEIIAAANRCSTAEGNIIKWTDFHDKISGNLKLACSRFCDD